MKQILIALTAMVMILPAEAQKKKGPVLKFDRTTINVGTFPAESPVKVCHFTFTNTGDADLYIHQAFASCGCTVPQVPIEPIKPGQSDTITVTYDGTNKSPGNLRKSITIHNNSKDEMIKIYIMGKRLPAKEKPIKEIEIDEE